jgi:hypothetical protein
MKKSLLTLLLALVALAAGQTSAAQAGQQPAAPAAQSAPPQQKKEIKDPAEYNTYVAALRESNPQAQAQSLESFLKTYPNSVVKEDALVELMAAYQKLGDGAKLVQTANLLLQVSPDNLRALALVAFTKRTAAQAGQDQAQNGAQALQFGQRGLQALQAAPKPDGTSDADWNKLKEQITPIFYGAAGFGAYLAKDYPTAQKDLQAAVDLRVKQSPSDPAVLSDMYPLALSYLEVTPINPIGLWWIARAAALSNDNPQIVKYGQFKYTKYHGSPDGWDQLLAQAKASPTPPANFAVAPAPSPAEQAKTLADSKDPKKMSFDEWEVVLSQGAPDVQEKVWSQIKGLEVPFAAKVITATKDKLELAATADDIDKSVADVTVTMVAACNPPKCKVPKPGDETQVIAKLSSYTNNPFMITMDGGQYIAKETPRPAKKPAAR